MESWRKEEIQTFIFRQINSFYGLNESDTHFISKHLDQSVDRTLYCFSKNKNRNFKDNDIDQFHTGQMMIFLYYLSNTIFREERKNDTGLEDEARRACGKVYCLNKLTSQCDIYYEFTMPDYFIVYHPLGSVISRSVIGNGFMLMQGSTVGENNGIHPQLGKNVLMFSNSKVLGNCHVGNNVLISANSYIKDMDIPDYSIVYGQYPNVKVVSNKSRVEEKISEYFEI